MTFENKKNILIHMSLSIWVFACIFDIEIKLDDDIIGLGSFQNGVRPLKVVLEKNRQLECLRLLRIFQFLNLRSDTSLAFQSLSINQTIMHENNRKHSK